MKEIINDAIGSHLAWTGAFKKAIESQSITEAVKFSGYDDMCTFGKWLYSLGDEVKRRPAYRLVKDLHYRFHTEAGEIVRLMKNGEFNDARTYLSGEYAVISDRLVQALRDWQREEISKG